MGRGCWVHHPGSVQVWGIYTLCLDFSVVYCLLCKDSTIPVVLNNQVFCIQLPYSCCGSIIFIAKINLQLLDERLQTSFAIAPLLPIGFIEGIEALSTNLEHQWSWLLDILETRSSETKLYQFSWSNYSVWLPKADSWIQTKMSNNTVSCK